MRYWSLIRFVLILGIISILLKYGSCNSLFGVSSLGGKYYYSSEGKNTTIIWTRTEKYEGSGITVIEPTVVDYKYNKNFIVVKTMNPYIVNYSFWGKLQGLDSLSSDIINEQFWLIDKTVSINPDDWHDQAGRDSVFRSVTLGPFTLSQIKMLIIQENIGRRLANW